jgi:chromosome partitioning protein
VLSTYGIPQILRRVANFAAEMGEILEPLGIVVTKYQDNSTVHINGAKQLRQTPNLPRVFNTMIKQANQIAAAAEYAPGTRRTLKQKYGYNELADRYIDLARELMDVVEA